MKFLTSKRVSLAKYKLYIINLLSSAASNAKRSTPETHAALLSRGSVDTTEGSAVLESTQIVHPLVCRWRSAITKSGCSAPFYTMTRRSRVMNLVWDSWKESPLWVEFAIRSWLVSPFELFWLQLQFVAYEEILRFLFVYFTLSSFLPPSLSLSSNWIESKVIPSL